MKVLAAVSLQLLSLSALANTATTTMSVTVTVVKPSPVVTVVQATGGSVRVPQVKVSESTAGLGDTIRIISIEY